MTTLIFRNLGLKTTILLLVLALGACQEDEILKLNDPPANGESPAPNTPAPDTQTPPNNPETPASQFKGKKVELRSSQSVQLIEYNEEGLLVRYTSNSNNEFIHNFEYDANKKLVNQTTNKWGSYHYYYNGEVLTKVVQTDLLDRPLKEFQLAFNAQNQLIESHGFNVSLEGDKVEYMKVTYEYDQKGNIAVLKNFVKNSTSGRFELETALHFEDYDNKKNSMPFWVSPYLPQITFWVNNPGKKYGISKNGEKMVNSEVYNYNYNEAGYPVSKTTSIDTGEGKILSYTGTFTYTGL